MSRAPEDLHTLTLNAINVLDGEYMKPFINALQYIVFRNKVHNNFQSTINIGTTFLDLALPAHLNDYYNSNKAVVYFYIYILKIVFQLYKCVYVCVRTCMEVILMSLAFI